MYIPTKTKPTPPNHQLSDTIKFDKNFIITDDNKRTIQRVQTKYNSCHLLHFIEAIYGLSHASGGKSG